MNGRAWDVVTLTGPRRRRRVARLLRQMERLDRRRPWLLSMRESRVRAASAVALLMVLILGAWMMNAVGNLGDSSSGGRVQGWPSAPSDREESRLASSVEVVETAGTFEFMKTQPGSEEPVTYDPCAPIHLVINPRTIVDNGSRILVEAVDAVQDASGLVITVDGLVDERPTKNRASLTRDGSAWRPVLVSWTDPKESRVLRGDTAGIGGSMAFSKGSSSWFVTGVVELDGPQLETMLARQGGRAAVRAVVMHELGHLVGLNHVDDPGELMQPKGREGVTDWGPGDRRGLAVLGAGRCVDY